MSADIPTPEDVGEEKLKTFSDLVYANKVNLILIFLGLIFLGSGIVIIKNSRNDTQIEVIESAGDTESKNILVEIAGAVEKPGVYTFPQDSRVEDLLIASGGLSADADRIWVEKNINRAARLADGQKYYLPRKDEQSLGSSADNSSGGSDGFDDAMGGQNQPLNINTASREGLESLPGIGHVYAQSIIEHRPYSNIGELVDKGALKDFVYEKIKDMISVY